MTFSQRLTAWALRALVLWGALELGLDLYDETLRQSASARTLAAHRAVIERLEARAHDANEQARALEAQATLGADEAPLVSASEAENLAATYARGLREDLLSLGAAAPVIDAAEVAAAGELRQIALDARWREPHASPSLMHALAARHPELSLAGVSMTRLDGDGLVEVAAKLEARLRAAPEARP